METPIIGRKKEIEILQEALASNEAEMVAVLGRRRVGKTFLVSTVYKEHIVFEISGTQNTILQLITLLENNKGFYFLSKKHSHY